MVLEIKKCTNQSCQELKEESEVGVVMYIYIPSKRINNTIPINQVFLDYSNVQKSFF